MRRYREISHIAYFTIYGQTGNNTRANIPAMPIIALVWLDADESNLKQQNLGGVWAEYETGSSCFGYLMFFISSGLLK